MDSPRRHLSEPVPWGMFYAVVGLLISVFFGWLQNVSAKADAAQTRQEQVFVQLSQIQADLKNLDARIAELRNDIKNTR